MTKTFSHSLGRYRPATAYALINVARMTGAALGVATMGAVYALYKGGASGLRAALLMGGAAQLACGATAAVAFQCRAFNACASLCPVQRARHALGQALDRPCGGCRPESYCAQPRYYLPVPTIGALASQARHDSRPQSSMIRGVLSPGLVGGW